MEASKSETCECHFSSQYCTSVFNDPVKLQIDALRSNGFKNKPVRTLGILTDVELVKM